MRRSNPGKSKKTSIPPIRKDPKVFEKAFEIRLGQTPVDYLIAKIQSGLRFHLFRISLTLLQLKSL